VPKGPLGLVQGKKIMSTVTTKKIADKNICDKYFCVMKIPLFFVQKGHFLKPWHKRPKGGCSPQRGKQ
jgi:hypothetical protein